jgi:hypothetical protein
MAVKKYRLQNEPPHAIKFLPFTNLGKKLRLKYRVPITALIFAFIAASFVPTWYCAFWLAHGLGIRDHVPLKGQPHMYLWLGLFVSVFVASIMVFYLASFIFMAAFLKWYCGWTSDRIRKLIFDSDVPKHWFKDEDTTQQMAGANRR